MRITLAALALCVGASPGLAAPKHYMVDAAHSSIGFIWRFGNEAVTGRMMVASGDAVVDFANLTNSTVDVDVIAASAEAGFPFATQAMRGPTVLDTQQFPTIRFHSSDVRKAGSGAIVRGDLTLRGVTRPIAFATEIYRQTGSEPTDLSHLTILLTGTLKRSEFGATGWSDAVGDDLTLRILARIEQVS
jgi:polyisoprenoid-binding protein YceI